MDSDENEAYVSLQSPARELSVIISMRKEGALWKNPKISSFSGQYTDLSQ